MTTGHYATDALLVLGILGAWMLVLAIPIGIAEFIASRWPWRRGR